MKAGSPYGGPSRRNWIGHIWQRRLHWPTGSICTYAGRSMYLCLCGSRRSCRGQPCRSARSFDARDGDQKNGTRNFQAPRKRHQIDNGGMTAEVAIISATCDGVCAVSRSRSPANSSVMPAQITAPSQIDGDHCVRCRRRMPPLRTGWRSNAGAVVTVRARGRGGDAFCRAARCTCSCAARLG